MQLPFRQSISTLAALGKSFFLEMDAVGAAAIERFDLTHSSMVFKPELEFAFDGAAQSGHDGHESVCGGLHEGQGGSVSLGQG